VEPSGGGAKAELPAPYPEGARSHLVPGLFRCRTKKRLGIITELCKPHQYERFSPTGLLLDASQAATLIVRIEEKERSRRARLAAGLETSTLHPRAEKPSPETKRKEREKENAALAGFVGAGRQNSPWRYNITLTWPASSQGRKRRVQ